MAILKNTSIGTGVDPASGVILQVGNKISISDSAAVFDKIEVKELTIDGKNLNDVIYIDLSDYITNGKLTDILDGYVSNNKLTTELNDYVTNDSLGSTLNNYTTNTNLSSTLENYVDKDTLTTTLNNYVTSTGLSSTLNNYVKTENLKWSEIKDKPDIETENSTLKFLKSLVISTSTSDGNTIIEFS